MSTPAHALSRPDGYVRANLVTTTLVFFGEIAALTSGAVGFLFKGRVSTRNVLLQMSAIGVGSLPIVVSITFSTGAVVAFYTSSVFVRFGATQFVGGTLTYSFLNELGPVLAGVAVAARSGAAIAAEIGSMVVTEQVDALRSLAVSPVRSLVVPRMAALVMMMPVLGVFGDVAGIYGAYLMSGTRG